MPRYFFNVCSDAFEETDVVGQACRDDVEALERAMTAASDVVRRGLLSQSFAGDGWIEIEDERHRSVMTLPLRAAAY
jgi:hypothetical protein